MTDLLPLTVAAAVVLALGYCTVVLLRHRRSRLATASLLSPRRGPSALVLPLEKRPALVSAGQTELARVSTLTLREAEDLLDWLEQHGYQGRGLVPEADGLVAVEFRVDAGHAMPTTLYVLPTQPARQSSVG